MSEVIVQNVVALAEISILPESFIDLRKISAKIQGARFNSKRFPAVVIRKTKPKGTALIFRSGKVIIIGCLCDNDCQLIAKKVIKDMNRVFNAKHSLKSFKITNMVGTVSLQVRLNLGQIADDCLGIKDDNFPGLVYRMNGPVKSVLIFGSGKMIFCGATSIKDLENGFNIMKKVLKKYIIYEKREDSEDTN